MNQEQVYFRSNMKYTGKELIMTSLLIAISFFVLGREIGKLESKKQWVSYGYVIGYYGGLINSFSPPDKF